ncbi:translocon-associated protein subunit delta-like [Clavelina lepadiformis]|uniref:Translocon-associated protein subunit delta n=1 Tax=Clavelina lepadiformis TaxID=159417 RepID=A0ABP0GHV7_CLALP
MSSLKLFLCLFLAYCVNGQSCIQPSVSPSSYSSTNQKLSKSTAFVVEFSLKCASKTDNLQLYADIDGVQFPVTKSSESEHYQVSWTVKDKKTVAHNFDVRFFDEEGYNNLRKVIRSGQSPESIKPLFNVDFQHPGLSSGFWIKAEFLGLAVAVLVLYVVCRERSQIIS